MEAYFASNMLYAQEIVNDGGTWYASFVPLVMEGKKNL